MSLSGSAASILLHAFVLTTLLLLADTVSTSAFVPVVDHRDGVNTTMFTNGSSLTSPKSAENWEMYYCFLCTGRHPLLIHHCPIYWDECHLNCWDAIPEAPAPLAPVPPSSLVGSSAHPTATVQGKECYVMKLYMSGRYVIVERLSCDGIAACFLTCGGGELDDQKVAMGTAATTVPATMTAAMQQGSFVPFELCNTQVNALRAPPSAGVVVPAGGAH